MTCSLAVFFFVLTAFAHADTGHASDSCPMNQDSCVMTETEKSGDEQMLLQTYQVIDDETLQASPPTWDSDVMAKAIAFMKGLPKDACGEGMHFTGVDYGKDNDFVKVCEACAPGCAQCLGASMDLCLKCKGNQVLQLVHHFLQPHSLECRDSCLDGYEPDEGYCHPVEDDESSLYEKAETLEDDEAGMTVEDDTFQADEAEDSLNKTVVASRRRSWGDSRRRSNTQSWCGKALSDITAQASQCKSKCYDKIETARSRLCSKVEDYHTKIKLASQICKRAEKAAQMEKILQKIPISTVKKVGNLVKGLKDDAATCRKEADDAIKKNKPKKKACDAAGAVTKVVNNGVDYLKKIASSSTVRSCLNSVCTPNGNIASSAKSYCDDCDVKIAGFGVPSIPTVGFSISLDNFAKKLFELLEDLWEEIDKALSQRFCFVGLCASGWDVLDGISQLMSLLEDAIEAGINTVLRLFGTSLSKVEQWIKDKLASITGIDFGMNMDVNFPQLPAFNTVFPHYPTTCAGLINPGTVCWSVDLHRHASWDDADAVGLFGWTMYLPGDGQSEFKMTHTDCGADNSGTTSMGGKSCKSRYNLNGIRVRRDPGNTVVGWGTCCAERPTLQNAKYDLFDKCDTDMEQWQKNLN